MAETTFSRLNMRYGLIYHASDANMAVTDMDSDEADKSRFVLSAETLGDGNYIRIFGEKIPLFSPSVTSYKGEAVFAVFSSDYETSAIARRDAKINFQKLEEGDKVESVPKRDEYSFGNMLLFQEEEENEGKEEESTEETLSEEERNQKKRELKKISTTYVLECCTSPDFVVFKTTAWIDGANLHIMVPSEYPDLIRRNVSEITSYKFERVIIHPLEYHSPNDEYFYIPIKTACIAALAAERLHLPVEIRESARAERGWLKYDFTTYLDGEKPVASRISVEADLGRYPYLWREFQRQTMAAIIPPYHLEALHVEVSVKDSETMPSSLFGSLGYSEALGASEVHTSDIAKAIGKNPLEFRLQLFDEKRKFTDFMPAVDNSELKNITKSVGGKSYFERKWYSSFLQNGEFGLIGKLRGTGIASGIGISGFSTTFVTENEFQALLTYTQKDTVQINSSAFSHGTALKYWKRIIMEELGLESDNQVVFLPYGPDTKDSGPKVLSRFICNFSEQLRTGARRLKQLKESEKPPFSLLIDVENKFSPCEFDSGSFGSMVMEVEISESSLDVVVTRLWADFSLESVAEEERLMNAIKQHILRKISVLGAKLSPKSKMHVTFSHRSSENVAAITELVKGLTVGSLSNAIKEALGGREITLPVTAEKIRFALREKGEKK